MSKHTPGPWKVEGSIYEHMHSEIVSAMPGSERGIAQVWKHENAMADARLIAAAPELLEAVREIAKQWPDSSAAKTARAAISKAEGRS